VFRRPALRGAKRRSNPFSFAVRWIASRSLSSGAHSRDPLARNDGSNHANSNDDHCVTALLIARRLPQLATKMNSAVQKWHTFFAQNVIARCGLLSEN
jgi:hypothetical protein